MVPPRQAHPCRPKEKSDNLRQIPEKQESNMKVINENLVPNHESHPSTVFPLARKSTVILDGDGEQL